MSKRIINPFLQLAAFARLAEDNAPCGPKSALAAKHPKLLREEVNESFEGLELLEKAETDVEIVHAVAEIADGLVDTIVVACNWMTAMGLSVPELFAEVHRTNVAKIDPRTGKVEKRSDGKWIKPEGWTPPNLKAIVARQLGYIKKVGKDVDAQVARAAKQREKQAAQDQQTECVEKVYTPQQVALRLAASDSFVRSEIKAEKLKAAFWVGKSPRVTESALKAYMGAR